MNRKLNKGRPNRRTAPNRRKQSPSASPLRSMGTFVLAVMVFSGLSVGGHLLWKELRESPQLYVKHVQVSGLDRIEESELLAYADIAIDSPILEVNLDDVALAVNLHPWVAKASIRRKLPDTVTIEVMEHEPALLLAHGNVYVANVDGQLFKPLEADDGLDLPVLMGLPAPEKEETQTRDDNIRITQEAISLAVDMAAHSAALGQLQEIYHHPNLGWSMVTSGALEADEAMTIHLGREPLRRISVARQVVAQLKRRTRVPKIIWVDGKKNPDRVHVRFADSRDDNSETYIATAR